MVKLLSIQDKTAMLRDIRSVETKLGPAPLSNIASESLRPEDVDVVAAACVIYRKNHSIVLVRRAETPNEWVIPGGTVDAGEEILSSVVREVKEETGLDVEIDALLRLGLARAY